MSSKCVNLSSREFKDCCKRLNVSATSLEPIIHEYINIQGNELSFPSDVYINNKLNGRSIAVLVDEQIQLWEKRYSQPRQFDTQEEAVSYLNEANKFFPRESIGIKQTLDGKYEVRVAKPFNSNESDSTLNIWFGSGENDAQRENADLSNFAERPFTIDLSLNHKIANSIGFLNLYGSDIKVPTVEHAFQLAKLSFLPEEILSESSSRGKTTIEKLEEQILNASAAGAKKIGRTIPLTKEGVALWDKHSSTIMKVLIKASFEQNPEAFQKLLNTGNTTLTHTQDKGKWGKEFPRLLMEVREELRQLYGSEINILETSSIVESQKTLSPEELEEREENIQEYQNTYNVSREEAEKEIDAYLNNSTAEEVSEKSKTTDAHKKALNEKHQEYLSIDKQIKNLTESGIISRSEITELAYDIVYTMSDYLTKWQDNPESILEDIEDFNPENVKKIKGLSRADLVNLVGADNILNFIKDACFGRIPENSHLSDEEQDALLDKMFLVEENFKAVMQFGISAFATVEDFSLSFSEVGYKAVNTESKDTSSNDIQSNEAQHATEENGDKQEHWQVDSKTIDNILSMSQIVKRELVRLYEIEEVIDEETGLTTYEKKKNDYGMNKRVSPRDATYSILRWTEGALTLPKMVDRLKAKADSNLWVKTLLEKLTDTSGKYSDFQSQFYTTFCKHFQDYYIIKEEKAKDGRKVKKIMPVNRNPILRQTIKDIKVLYNIQKHPLFDNKGLKKNKYELLKQAKDKLLNFSKQPYASLDKKRLATGIQYVAELLGYNTTIEEVQQMLTEEGFNQMVNNLVPIVNNLGKGLNNLAYNPFGEFKDGGIENNLRNFLKPLLEAKEDLASDSVYDSGKMYQSRIIPSWLSKTMDKFLTLEGKEYQDFLEKEYGQYEWFRDTSMPITEVSSWINPWLRQLAGMSLENRKKVFGHHVNLNYLGHNYMRNMTEPEYILSVLTAFNSGNKDVKNIQTAWYKIPMMSNKPSLEFIKFKRYSGYGYQEEIVEELLFVFAQEVKRIKTVKARGYEEGDPQYIKNFDGDRGKSFVFLDYLNDYLPGGSKANKEVGKRLAAKLEDKKIESWTDKKSNTFSGDEALKEIVRQEIMDFMSQKAKSIINTYKTNGVYEVCKTIDGVGTTDTAIDEFLTEFVWNDTFASINILELTITDMAYYKDAEDVQKRLAQIHAPGLKGNIAAFDYGEYDENGKLVRAPQQVCDGNLRTIFLADFTKFKQNIIENLEIVFDRKIAQADATAKVYWRELKKNIIEQFEKDINVADAQAYNCLTSYRKKALMFGKWSQEAEELYNKLLNGEANISDIETAFQPLKPFVYTNVAKHSDAGEMSNLKVGMQFKNSEYLLIMADALLRGEDTGKPNLLRALFDVMEDSVKKKGINKGIDSFQFESAVKAGLQGTIDLTEFVEKGGDAKGYIESLIYDKNGNYVETRVHTFPAEDYSIQQEVPKHFMDHSQAHGSQERMIIPSDLPLTDAAENEVVFTYVSPDGKVVEKYNASTFREEYEKNLATNIEESIDNLYDELGLKFIGPDATKLRNIALSQILQKEILSSPRYGIDLYLACGVNENGEFNIPLGDPIQSKRVEQLINSIIKNRVNKQKIAGGPVVQVSNFGMSERLNIKFRDKDGNILPTFDEWSKDKKNEGKTIEDFKKELKEKQGGIAYYECYAPAYMRELFTDFMDENGNIDVEAVEKVNPEMLEMVGYRIPSEDAYSIAPLRIKGFLPKEAGEGIVMPYEIVLITGSDFDIDKFYLMRKEFNVTRNNFKEIRKALQKANPNMKYDDILDFMKKAINPKTRYEAFKENPILGKQYRQLATKVTTPKEGKRARNNKAINMTLAVLNHETTAARILNPGGFEPQKRMGYLVSAYKMNLGDWNELSKLSTKQLKAKCMTNKNLSYMDVNTQFYAQNNAAGSILGMFAVQKIAHAVLENNGLHVDINTVLGLDPEVELKFAGHTFHGYTEFDSTLNSKGEYIGKVLGSLVASAADAVKDPVLNLMNINSTTANVLTTMIRMGIPFETAALLTSQQVITDAITEFNVEAVKGNFSTLSDIINKRLNTLKESVVVQNNDQLSTEEFTLAELQEGLASNKDTGTIRDEVKYKGLLNFQRFLTLSGELKGPTYATRFNSISNAVGPHVTDNLMMEKKLDNFSSNIYVKKGGSFENIGIDYIFNSHPILKQFSRTVGIARDIFKKDIPILNSEFESCLSKLDEGISDKMYNDKKLLSKYVDAFLSYCMIASGCIDEKSSRGLKYFITEYPKEFINSAAKKDLSNNAFIAAIKLEYEAVSDRYVLKIDTSGLDTMQKEKLSSGWSDLFNTHSDIAIDLFKYCFYRGGIGFNPKAFMHLLPIEMKQKLDNYKESFSKVQSVTAETFNDQFVRNNWGNNKIAPRVEITWDKLIYNEKTGKHSIQNTTEANKVKSFKYIKIKDTVKKDHLFKVTFNSAYKTAELEEMSPLGNNGEFFEMSTGVIKESLQTPEIAEDYNNDDSIPTNDDSNANNTINPTIEMTEQEKQHYLNEIYKHMKSEKITEFSNKPITEKQQLTEKMNKWFKDKGIISNDEEFNKVYKMFCGV